MYHLFVWFPIWHEIQNYVTKCVNKYFLHCCVVLEAKYEFSVQTFESLRYLQDSQRFQRILKHFEHLSQEKERTIGQGEIN